MATTQVALMMDKLFLSDQYWRAFEDARITTYLHVLKMEDADWERLRVKPFHRVKIFTAAELEQWGSGSDEEEEGWSERS